MLIKNGGTIMDGISMPLRLLARIRCAPAALLLGGFVLLFGSQLTAQDFLLKEYIYLDGRLLAVERQIVTLTAQQPAADADRATETRLALPFTNHGITPARRRGCNRDVRYSKRAGDALYFIARVSPGFFLPRRTRTGSWPVTTPRCGWIPTVGIGRHRELSNIETEGTMTACRFYSERLICCRTRFVCGAFWDISDAVRSGAGSSPG